MRLRRLLFAGATALGLLSGAAAVVAPAASASNAAGARVIVAPAAHQAGFVDMSSAKRTASGSMCTTFGPHHCLGVGNISLGEQMISVNEPGRTMFWGGGGVGTISTICFKNNPSLCIAPSQNSNNVKVVLGNAFGTNWQKLQGPTGFYWFNTRTGFYLTEFDCLGCIIAVGPHPFPGGGEQQWNGPA